MSEPTKITTHSADVLKRLISWAQGKPNIEAVLRSVCAGRLDILDAVEAAEYALEINGCRVSYTAERNDDQATIAGELVELINAGSGVVERDTFDDYELGYLAGQVGPFGTWSDPFPFGPSPPGAPDVRSFLVNDQEFRTGDQSIRTTNEQGLYVGTDPFIGNVASIPIPNAPTIVPVEFHFKFDAGYPNLTPGIIGLIPVGFFLYGSGPAVLVWLYTSSDFTEYYLSIGPGGGPGGFTVGPYPLADLLTGDWNKFNFTLDQSNGDVTWDINDGSVSGSDTLSTPIPVSQFAFTSGVLGKPSPPTELIRGVKNSYIDDLKIGGGKVCGEYDPDTFVPNADESVESFTSGLSFDGTGEWADWVDDYPGGSPPASFLGGYLVNNADARTGSQSIRTTHEGGLGPDTDTGDGINVYNIATAAIYPGNDSDYQEGVCWFKVPSGGTFPGATFQATGAGIWPVVLAFIDFSSGSQLWGAMSMSNVDSYTNYFINIAAPGQGAGASVAIPRAALEDGNYHKLRLRFNLSGGTAELDVDDDTYTATFDLPFTFTSAPAFTLLSYFDGLAGTVFDVPNIYIDDIVAGGDISLVVSYQAKQLTPEDPFLYIYPKGNPGLELDILPADETRTRMYRLGVVDQLQELEDALFGVLLLRALDTAQGEQLNKLGTILGETRSGGVNDEDYRQLLGVRITRNLSSGEPERLINVTKAITNSSIVQLIEFFPGVINIAFDGEPGNENQLRSILDQTAAGGVRLQLTEVVENPFVFAGDDDGLGFDEGEFVRALE